MSISWVWVPGKSVGPFRFGEDAVSVINRYELIRLEQDCSVAYWETYAIPEYESTITTEEGKVASVLCSDSLMLDDVNLLGLSFEDAKNTLGQEDELERNVGLGEAAYYNRMGLTLWITDGVVRRATCETPLEF